MTRNMPRVTYFFLPFNWFVWVLGCSHIEKFSVSHVQEFFSPPTATPCITFLFFYVYCWTKRLSIQYLWCSIQIVWQNSEGNGLTNCEKQCCLRLKWTNYFQKLIQNMWNFLGRNFFLENCAENWLEELGGKFVWNERV